MYGPEGPVVGHVGRIIRQRVLVTDVVSDLRADGLGVIRIFREKG